MSLLQRRFTTAPVICGLLFLFSATLHAADSAKYLVQIENVWSESTHPGAFPNEAHFSWVAGGTHVEQLSLWSVGMVASPGMVEMAESGVTDLLVGEMQQAIDGGLADSLIDQRNWFCPDGIDAKSCGSNEFEFTADTEFPLLSLATMLGPSPDWFVGVDRLSLRDETGWIDHFQMELYPYDAGTRSSNAFALWGPQNDPPAAISHITTESGQLITAQSLGTLTLRRLLPCDLNGDFDCTSDDIDLLTSGQGGSDLGLDLNGDGIVGSADRAFWVEDLMGTQFGDANLDGEVGFADFLSLSQGFGQTGTWSTGDADGSGFVDFADFLSISQNFGFSAATATSVAVPEPQGTALSILGWLAVMMWASRSWRPSVR